MRIITCRINQAGEAFIDDVIFSRERIRAAQRLLGDIDLDGSVGISDLLILLAQWGPCPPKCFGDLDGDGDVGITDLLILLANWGPCP